MEGAIPERGQHEAIESLEVERKNLLKALDVQDVWNDGTYERFKNSVYIPVRDAVRGFEEDATDMYEDMSAALFLAEQLMVAQEACGRNFWSLGMYEPRCEIDSVRRKMFPHHAPLFFDYLFDTEDAHKDDDY